MSNKRKQNGGRDPYKEMYDRQFEKFNNMDKEKNGADDDLRFYSEEELDAIEQAKRDAAERAYQDAYREQYNRSKNQRKKVGSSSQRYASEALKKHKAKQIEFGRKNSYANSKKGKRQLKGSSAAATLLKGIFAVIIVLIVLFQLLIFRYIGLVNSVDTDKRLYGDKDAEISDPKVQNILLIGSDARDEDTRGRTDTMIMLSINSETKEVTMTSFMRDSWVEIPDHGWAKMNAAYAYGGAELLMDTIELNFGVDIDRYVYVSFYSFIDIVDAAGGIELDISDEEAIGMTDPMAEQNKYLGNKKGTDYLTKGGKGMTVNGNQALAYARLRYVGNADFERTERQRTVILKIIEKAKTLSPLKLDNFVKVAASNLTTNMSSSEMYLFFYKLLFSMNFEINQLRIPPEGAFYYGNHDGQSTLDLDFDRCKKEISDNIYK